MEPRPAQRARTGARPPQPKQPRTRATRARVLRPTAKLLEARGYERMSMTEIALEAGIGTGTLYHHFPDKRAILLELLDAWAERVAADRRSELQLEAFMGEDPRAALTNILYRIHERLRGGNWFYAEIFRMLDRDAEVRRRYQQLERVGSERLTAMIEFGQRRGMLRKEPDPQTASLLVIHAIEVLMSHVLVLRRSPEEVERVRSELTDMLCRYLVSDRATPES